MLREAGPPAHGMQKQRRTIRRMVRRVEAEAGARRRDLLLAEEPLSILWQAWDGPVQRLAATMRTPGDDYALAAGLLFSEGLLRRADELETLSFCASGAVNELNRLRARLRLPLHEVEARWAHRPSHTLPQSACGVCGTEDLSSVAGLLDWVLRGRAATALPHRPSPLLLAQALQHLEERATLFAATGASHACVIVDREGSVLSLAEDVGRHNACDKAIGVLLLSAPAKLPFALPAGSGVVFSSRLSFELAAKAIRAGASWIGAVGAPTSLAVELASRCSLPTFGFLRPSRFNEYC